VKNPQYSEAPAKVKIAIAEYQIAGTHNDLEAAANKKIFKFQYFQFFLTFTGVLGV